MESLLNRLYAALGLDAPEDEPLLIIDDGIQVYFNESDHTLEMCCPFMPLPDDTLTLQHFLRLNYASAVTIGADADNTALVALYRLPQTSTEEEALTGFELFISNVKQLKERYAQFNTSTCFLNEIKRDTYALYKRQDQNLWWKCKGQTFLSLISLCLREHF